MNKIYNYNFWKSLLFKQNQHHNHGVFLHTILVLYYILKFKQFKMVPAAILHDFGKPFVAKQDNKDIERGMGELSFTNHEEISYQIIKNWNFISDYTKQLVRYHYLIRNMKLCKKRGQFAKYNRLYKKWKKLDNAFKKDLEFFLKADDLGKK